MTKKRLIADITAGKYDDILIGVETACGLRLLRLERDRAERDFVAASLSEYMRQNLKRAPAST